LPFSLRKKREVKIEAKVEKPYPDDVPNFSASIRCQLYAETQNSKLLAMKQDAI